MADLLKNGCTTKQGKENNTLKGSQDAIGNSRRKAESFCFTF